MAYRKWHIPDIGRIFTIYLFRIAAASVGTLPKIMGGLRHDKDQTNIFTVGPIPYRIYSLYARGIVSIQFFSNSDDHCKQKYCFAVIKTIYLFCILAIFSVFPMLNVY